MSGLITPLILCGGAGTRLWPASREGQPKQFLRLFGAHSTFQETLRRVADPALFARPVIISNSRYRLMIDEQLAEIGAQADILLEPMRRDSGPAIAAGVEFIRGRGGDPVIITLAADHVVTDQEGFVQACVTARGAAEQGWIVTFGVRPERPATEYGYIQPAASIDGGVFAVERFVEKPNAETAARYVAEGYLWNSGNFMFRAGILLEEYTKFEPASAKTVAASVAGAKSESGCLVLDAPFFAEAHGISIDYAVMEQTKRAAVVPVSFGWSDVGSWQAVWELASKDSNENCGQGNAVFLDTSGSYVTTHKTAVALFGVKDLVVVGTKDAVLVASRERAAELKPLVEQLRKSAPRVVEDHIKTLEPWGSHEVLDDGKKHRVRRLLLKPGAQFPVQLMERGIAHVIVIRGTIKTDIGPRTVILHEGESRPLPGGQTYWMENPTATDAEVIEVFSEAVAAPVTDTAG